MHLKIRSFSMVSLMIRANAVLACSIVLKHTYYYKNIQYMPIICDRQTKNEKETLDICIVRPSTSYPILIFTY